MLGLTQAQVADRMGMSRTNYLKIEKNEEVFYTQESLALVAMALERPMADLIMWNPMVSGPESVWSVWEGIPENRRPQALDVLKTFASKKTDQPPPPPAPQPPPAAPSNRVTPRLKNKPTDAIGREEQLHVYLAEWIDHQNMEPADLVKRMDISDAAPDAIPGLISGKYDYDAKWLYKLATALGVRIEQLYGPPPKAEAKSAKTGKKAAKR